MHSWLAGSGSARRCSALSFRGIVNRLLQPLVNRSSQPSQALSPLLREHRSLSDPVRRHRQRYRRASRRHPDRPRWRRSRLYPRVHHLPGRRIDPRPARARNACRRLRRCWRRTRWRIASSEIEPVGKRPSRPYRVTHHSSNASVRTASNPRPCRCAIKGSKPASFETMRKPA